MWNCMSHPFCVVSWKQFSLVTIATLKQHSISASRVHKQKRRFQSKCAEDIYDQLGTWNLNRYTYMTMYMLLVTSIRRIVYFISLRVKFPASKSGKAIQRLDKSMLAVYNGKFKYRRSIDVCISGSWLICFYRNIPIVASSEQYYQQYMHILNLKC